MPSTADVVLRPAGAGVQLREHGADSGPANDFVDDKVWHGLLHGPGTCATKTAWIDVLGSHVRAPDVAPASHGHPTNAGAVPPPCFQPAL